MSAFLAAVLALPPRADAATITWTGSAGDNLYNNANNWSPAFVPNGLTYDASIDNDTVNVNISPSLDSLNIGSNGTVNVLSGNTLTLGPPTTPGATVLTNGGSLNVMDGGALVLASNSDVAISNSVLTLNANTANSSLTFNSAGSAANFTLTGGGTIYLSDNPNNFITGMSGSESLTNDISHTIQGAGTIGGFSSFTNAGTLTATGSNVLNVAAPLSSASWDGANLIGGTYNTSGTPGGNIQLNLGTGNTLTGLTVNASVTLNGGLLTSAPTTDAVSSLNAITDSSLTISGASETITPAGGTLAVSTSGLQGFSLSSLNVSGGNLTINGELSNSAFGNSSTVMLTNGSTVAVTGGLTQYTDPGAISPASTLLDNSTLTLGGAFTQLDTQSTLSLANGSMLSAQGLNSQGVIIVDSSSSADFRTVAGGGFANLSGGTLTGGTYNISGSLYYDADSVTGGGITALAGGANITLNQGGQMLFGGAQGSAGTVDLTNLSRITDSSLSLYSSSLQNISGPLSIGTTNGMSSLLIDGGTLTIGGGLNSTSSAPAGISAIGNSSVTVQDNSTLTVLGLYSQSVNTLTSVLDVNGVGSQLYAQGLNNLGEIDVDPNSTADFRTGGTGTFQNLSGGVLSGGTYNISGTLNYDASAGGGQITQLNGATVTLNGAGQMLYGGAQGTLTGTQAFSALNNITDSAFTLNNETALNSVSGGLAINSVGASSSLNLNGTSFAVHGNLISTSGTFVSAVNVESGSSLSVNGSVNISGNTTVSGGSSLAATGSFTQNSGATLNVYGSTVSALGLNNNGSISLDSTSTADFRTGSAGGFTNLSGGTLTGGSLIVAGTLLVDGSINKIGTGTSLTLSGTGSILSGGATGSGTGTATNALSALAENDGTLVLGNGASLTTASVFTNKGALTINGTTSKLTAGTEYLQTGGTTTVQGTLSSSTIDIAGGAYTQTSKFTNTGTFMLGAGATAGFTNGSSSLGGFSAGSLSTGTWDIAGTMTYSAGGKITDIGTGATIDLIGAGIIKTANANALSTLAKVEGTLDISGGDSLSTTTAFTNSGVVNISGGPGVDALTVTGQFTNKGAVTVGAGDTLTATGGNYVQSSGSTTVLGMLTAGTVQINGGLLFGTGTISGNLLDAAVVDPGDPGTLTVTGNYTQTAAGDLTVDVDGATSTLYDNLAIGGNVSLNGILDVNLASTFLSSIYTNETFRFLAFSGALTGNFSTVEYSVDGNLIGNAAALNAAYALNFSEQVDAHDITFGVTVTPEPGTWFLLSLGMALIAAFEYRRRRSALLRLQ